MSNSFDLVVLGSGPAASTVADKLAKAGRSVALVESQQVGGTCALRGCNPKKVYVNAAMLMQQVRGAEGKLGRFANSKIVWSDLLRFKREFTDPVPESSIQGFREAGIEVLVGAARFLSPSSLEVAGQTIEADRFMVGVGARPASLGIAGEEYLMQSDQFMELEQLPERVVFVGGGYISMEFAHAVAQSGVDVMVLHSGDRILDGFDPDLVDKLTEWSTQHGVEIRTGCKVTGISEVGEGGYEVRFQDADGEQTTTAGLVVHGAGRVPNLDGLQLEKADVRYGPRGIEVDEYMRSSNPAIYAAGDCAASGQPKLTPIANEEARCVAKNLLSDAPTAKPFYGAPPRVVFTAPCLAAVGASEKQLAEEGRDYTVNADDTSTWGSVRKSGIRCAAYKVLVDKQSDRVLGAHLLGPGAEESINLFALAMSHGLTATQIKSTLLAFPTFASDVRQMV